MKLHRPAYSLVELLATLGMTSLLLAMLAGWLTAMFRHQLAAREHLLATTSQDRVARQFRADVHAASGVLPLDSATPDVWLKLQLPECQVRYEQRSRGVERIEEAAGRPRRREQYPMASSPRVERISSGDHERLALLLGPGLRIEATVGSDRRWTGGAP